MRLCNAILLTSLVLCGLSNLAWAESSVVQPMSVNTTNPQVPGFAQPTDNPEMSLLQGKLLFVDILPGLAVTKDSVHKGTGYIVVQYKGKENIANSANFIIKNMADIIPLRDLSVFASLGHNNTGSINLDDLVKAGICLVNYDAHGYVSVQALQGLNIGSATYNATTNTLEFLTPRDNRTVLSGSIVDFK